MKNFILVFFALGLLQTAVAQQKKKVTTTVKKSVVVQKPVVPSRNVVNKTPTPAPKKEVEPQNKPASAKSTSSVGYKEGDFQLNAGIGASSWGVPFYVGADYFVTNDISVGGTVSYQTLNETFYVTQYKSTIIGIGATGNYHFNRVLKLPKEWDVYAGLGISYFIWSFDSNNYVGANSSGIAIGGQIGGRYFFNKKFAINAELGGASTTSGARLGITYKL